MPIFESLKSYFGIKNLAETPAIKANLATDLTVNDENGRYFLSEAQVKLMEHIVPGFTNPKQLMTRLKQMTKIEDPNLLYRVVSAYTYLYTKASEDYKNIIKDIDSVKNFYLVDAMINQMTEDALSPDVASGDIITITSSKPEIQRELDYLEDLLDFDDLLFNICPDLLIYGEYTFSTKVIPIDGSNFSGNKEESGLLELNDDTEPGKVLSLIRNNRTQGYLVLDEKGFRIAQPADFIKFSLSSYNVRINLHKELLLNYRLKNLDALNKLPKFVRLGKSVLFSVMPKIRELQLLESLVPSMKLANLSTANLVGVPVGANYDLDLALEACQKIENLINPRISVDQQLGQLTIENILAASGKLKCVPIFGEKGQITKLDYKSEDSDSILNILDDVRRGITSSIGIPFEILFSSHETIARSELLKRYARYIRKLKQIQRSLDLGARQIIYIHLANKNISFKEEDIKIVFRNKLVEIDSLDSLEFNDALLMMLGNINTFYNNLSGNPDLERYLNPEGFIDFLRKQFKLVDMDKLLLKVPREKTKQNSMDMEFGGGSGLDVSTPASTGSETKPSASSPETSSTSNQDLDTLSKGGEPVPQVP